MTQQIHYTVDHLFRHEAGRMVAVLSRLIGIDKLEMAEDLVQDTLLQALHTWSYKGLPDNPAAWLHRAARNRAIDFLRRRQTFRDLAPEYAYLLQSEYTLTPTVDGLFEEDAIRDSNLRMIFACCHPSIPPESQIALALKTLCGLSTAEIAKAFLASEDTVAKRLYRAREKIRSEGIELQLPSVQELPARLDAVLHCLYLLFNEGYNSSQPDQLIREDLCEEALRLAYGLTQNEITNRSRTYALLALMCFQASRFSARSDEGGNIILLRNQDRSRWYRPLIDQGCYFLQKATTEESSTYHLEAAIAYLHAMAPSFEDTDWTSIYRMYGLLHRERPTAFIALNKAIAAQYAEGSSQALQELQQIRGLENYYLYHTAIGEVHAAMGDMESARKQFQKALLLTEVAAERLLLEKKIRSCGGTED